jgi:Ca2+-binding EF-hand superfamily protein
MVKIWFILNLLLFTAMTIATAPASEQMEKTRAPNMIERHDQDGDAKISIDEFPGPDEHFTRIDLDGDGSITEDEARQAPRPQSRSARVPGKFREDDVNGDGVVSRSEFSGPADHFDRLDLNGDGVIEEDEARQGPPDMPHRNRKNR